MRVQIAGLEQLGKVPAVIFESGGGGWSVDGWDPIFADIAKAAPVMAYDRAGYGRSAPDGQPPTPRHNAEKLQPSVPISIVLAGKREPWIRNGRPCVPEVCFERRLDFRRQWLQPWIANANPASITVDTLSGHLIPTDNPALVAAEIRKILALAKSN